MDSNGDRPLWRRILSNDDDPWVVPCYLLFAGVGVVAALVGAWTLAFANTVGLGGWLTYRTIEQLRINRSDTFEHTQDDR